MEIKFFQVSLPGRCNWRTQLLTEADPALFVQRRDEQRQRVRGLTQAELRELEF